MKFRIHQQTFHFKNPIGTSRGILTTKPSWFIEVWDDALTNVIGTGECNIIEGLSPDYEDELSYGEKLINICQILEDISYNSIIPSLNDFYNLIATSAKLSFLSENPSILFGLETAILDLLNGGKGIIFENDFSKGKRKIPINGLVWMGDEDFMKQQIDQKLRDGFTTIKMKVGAIDFERELDLLRSIRKNYSADQITLRVDANGAFLPKEARLIIEKLAELDIHSIEQPIKPGQWKAMKELCYRSPVAIALDEELIMIHERERRIELLQIIQPQFIILKPSLHGGIAGSKEWIELAEERNIQWWMTSALESNVGLNAICQFAGEYKNNLPQGLGTGSLYVDNTESDLVVENGTIFLRK